MFQPMRYSALVLMMLLCGCSGGDSDRETPLCPATTQVASACRDVNGHCACVTYKMDCLGEVLSWSHTSGCPGACVPCPPDISF